MERLGDPMTDEEADELMKMTDTNRDGRVSYDGTYVEPFAMLV